MHTDQTSEDIKGGRKTSSEPPLESRDGKQRVVRDSLLGGKGDGYIIEEEGDPLSILQAWKGLGVDNKRMEG